MSFCFLCENKEAKKTHTHRVRATSTLLCKASKVMTQTHNRADQSITVLKIADPLKNGSWIWYSNDFFDDIYSKQKHFKPRLFFG